MNEEWRPIPGFEGMYEVSSLARVRSVPRKWMHRGRFELDLPGRFISVRGHRNGYLRFDMHRRGRRVTMFLHQAVALAFLPNEAGRRVVNHKDGSRGNCAPGNLEWATNQENTRHYYDKF